MIDDQDKGTVGEKHHLDRLVPASCIGWGLVLGAVYILRFFSLRTLLFDTVVTGNVFWRLAHGFDDLSTLTGSHHLADHLSPIGLLLVPFFRWGLDVGLVVFMVCQGLSVGLVGVAVWKVARHLQLSPLVGLSLVGVAMLSPGAYLAVNFGVREFALGLGPLAMTIAGLIVGEPARRTAIWGLITAGVRVEFAVAVFIAGLVGYRAAPRPARAVLALSGFMSVALGAWLLFSPLGGASVGAHLGHLGASFGEVLETTRREPSRLLIPILDGDWVPALIGWLFPFGLVIPFLGGRWLLPAVPIIAIPILGTWPLADAYPEHYWHPLLVVGALSTTVGLGRIRRSRMIVPPLALTLVAVSWLILFPWSESWLLPGPTLDQAGREVIEYVESEPGSVSAPSPVIHHLAGRPQVHAFPRPFFCNDDLSPFASSSASAPDIVVTTDRLMRVAIPASEQRRFQEVLAGLYQEVRVEGDYRIFRRVSEDPQVLVCL